MDNLIYKFYKEPTLELLKQIFNEYNFHPNKFHTIIFGLSLLHVKQPYETMKYLLDKGGDPNINSYLSNKPIHFQKEFKTIRLLVDRGAIPNPRDLYDFNPLFWQKDLESVKYLLQYNPISNNNIYNAKDWRLNHYYNKMFIEGGYDPYSENNISITPLFLQRDLEVLDYLLEESYYNDIPNFDLAYETILFKPSITCKMIYKYDTNMQDINHKNILGNTALHVQYDPRNMLSLLRCKADYTIRNNDGLTPYEYHNKRNNQLICTIIERYSASSYIQDYWKRFWFRKTYVPPKYYKIKKKMVNEFTLLPPSECGTFLGGIEYQNAFEDFKSAISALAAL